MQQNGTFRRKDRTGPEGKKYCKESEISIANIRAFLLRK